MLFKLPITVQAGLRVRKLALHSNRSYGCAFRSRAALTNTNPAPASRDPGEKCGLAAGEQSVPALDDFGVAPGQTLFPVNMQNDMIVVTHHRINGDINGVDAGQNQQAVFDLLPSMYETAAAVAILAAQKGTAHAA